jgi:hypothetical protein
MAKPAKKIVAAVSTINLQLLAQIVDATQKGGFVYVTVEEGKPLVDHDPQLIEVNPTILDPMDANKAAARATVAGAEYVANAGDSVSPVAANDASATLVSAFSIITDAALPASRRGAGGGGAPIKYPFDKLEIGQSFFVPVSAEHPNPVKTLGSTVSSANMRYAEETGATREVTRAKRGDGNKALLDAAGNKVTETVKVPVYKYTRKFSIRAVKAGVKYGAWVAPSDGALIARVPIEDKQ